MQIPMDNADNGLGKRRFLPKNVTPIHYDLWIEPDLSSFTYKGNVSIQLEVLEETTTIVLNTFEIEVQHVKILKEDEPIGTPTCSQDIFQQQLTVLVGQKIPAGSFVTLQLSFHGIHNMQKVGLFAVKYDIDGKERRAVQTQMQPTSARRAWPCFDEPALKATWAIQLAVEPHLMCISNMTIKSEEDVDGRKLVTFHTTPKMSSYLLALVIGEDLHYVESKNWRIPMRVWAESKESAEKGHYALEVAEKAMKFYEDAFEYEYPLPKLDFATLPNAMLGAMENWGLLLYATDLLLYDPKVDSQAQREKVTSVHMHEMAHQWFSDLVTTQSWDATWLNEGFATWIELYSRNILYPEFHTWSSFISNGLRAALELDSLRSSHPIESVVEPGKEGDVLDRISYEKGCAIIRMISGYLGEKMFLKGVARYTNDHAFGSTTTDDLWSALTVTTGINIKNVMDPWIRNKGYPVIFVHEDELTDTIGLKQHRFLKSGNVEPEEDLTIWPIPLNIRTTDKIHHELFMERSAEIRLSLDFFVVNPDHTGFYRVAYSKSRLEKLATQVKAGLLTVDDRAGLLLDTGALAAAGMSKTSGLLTLGTGFVQETTFAVWRSLVTEIRAVRRAWMFQDLQVCQ
jgi:aminopeptidase 2